MDDQYEVKEGIEKCTEDFWYDLTDGGYIKPEDILVNPEDAEEVNAAIDIVKKFQRSCESQIEDFLI